MVGGTVGVRARRHGGLARLVRIPWLAIARKCTESVYAFASVLTGPGLAFIKLRFTMLASESCVRAVARVAVDRVRARSSQTREAATLILVYIT